MKRFSIYILYTLLVFLSSSNIFTLNANNLLSDEDETNCSLVSKITGQNILEGGTCNQAFDAGLDQFGAGFVFDLVEHSTGNIIATEQSDALGNFEFNNLSAGTYTVRERQEFGWFCIPFSIDITLSGQDEESVIFFNCPYESNVLAACIYGDITAMPTNTHDEKGLAVVHEGGFFGDQNIITFSSTDSDVMGPVGDEHIVGKKWLNLGGTPPANATITDFTDVSNAGPHSINNLHVLKTNIPCGGGTFAGVGTINNGVNRDVFYSEYNATGTMIYYTDITSTPSLDSEDVYELIELSNNGLMWVGTQRLASSFPSFNEPMISRMTSCDAGITHRVFSFNDNNGQVAATGRSVLELEIPLPGHPNAVYAMTGAIGNKTYLLLLNSNLDPTYARCFDIDGNTSTQEEGIRIRQEGNELFILGNSRQNGINVLPEEKIFMLKLGFLGQPTSPTILSNKLFNIPNGGERLVDVEMNFNGDLILTGVSELPSSILINSEDPEEQKTFLMGLDQFGNQLWLNQVQRQEGSEPADLKLYNLLDEISIVGTCWTNEISSNGGLIVNVRKFDEMIIKATHFGEVGFNTGCTIPLDATVSEPTAIICDFIPTPSTPVFTIEEGSLYYDDYTMMDEDCIEDMPPNVDCNNLSITPQLIDDPMSDGCCYTLDYNNNSAVPLYELSIQLPSGATFFNVSTNSNFTYTLISNTQLNIQSATSSTLPIGSILGAIDFCISGGTNISTIDVLWKDISDNVVCEGVEDSPVCDVNCDSLMLTPQIVIDPTTDDCCFTLDYKNNSPGSLYSISIRLPNSASATFVNVSTNSSFIYTLVNSNKQLNIESATSTTLPIGNILGAIDFCITGTTSSAITYRWHDNSGDYVCQEETGVTCDVCEADFTWTADCCTVQLDATANGTGLFTYEWDINCDNPTTPELTGQSVNWSFNTSGIYDVCLKVTDTATGCMSTVQKQVTVVDNPPTLTCPSDITIPMDPGLYIATHQLVDPTAIDDCTTMFTFGCSMSGATTGPANSPVTLNSGITTINCSTEDSKGQSDDCSYTITVEDQEPPTINCPQNINQNIPLCQGGLNVTLPTPTFADNCPNATISCSHQSGDYFTCGVTTVTCTATDMAGNVSTCSYNVIVNCQCIETVIGELSCTDVDNEYEFSVEIYDFSGANGNCTGTVTTNQAGVVISSQSSSTTTNPIIVTGTIQLASPPIPTNIVLTANMSCVCPDGNNIECSQNVSLAVPCCKEISVDPQEVCKTTSMVSVPLIGCNNLFDVQQVRWYISDAPCTAQGSFGAPFQVTNGCSPLVLDPRYHNADICVYAEVSMGSEAGACTLLTSNTATITLCEPIVCSVNSEEHCYFGTAITPGLLTAAISSDTTGCFVSAKWYDENNVQVGNGLIYQPPALSLSSGSQACSESFSYRCEISNICGTSICSGTVTLHNDDAPLGDLFLNPNEPMPFCPGEDAALQYDKACAGSPPEWNWFRSTDNFGSDITPLPSNGTMNDTYLTNRLYQDTWIRVEKQNGNCPIDEIDFFIDVIDELVIDTFMAGYTPLCNPTDITMSVDWTPNYSAASACDFTIDWYRNGVLLQSTIQNTSPANLSYSGSPLSGNYYAIIRDNCCGQTAKSNIVTIAPPMEVVIVGPCFRCNCETVTLEAVIKDEYAGCTYQWFENGVVMSGETGRTLTVSPNWATTVPLFIDYSFEITCLNGCSDTQFYSLRQCGDCIVDVVDEPKRISAILYPNPTAHQIIIEFGEPIEANTYLEITDLSGRRITYQPIGRGSMQLREDLSRFASGIYLINIMKDGFLIYSEKLVKE